jgi:hypothetical protein
LWTTVYLPCHCGIQKIAEDIIKEIGTYHINTDNALRLADASAKRFVATNNTLLRSQ